MQKRCSICILRRDEIQALEGRHCSCSGVWSFGAVIIHGRSPRLQGAVAEPCSIMQTEGHCWHARRGQGDKCLSPLPIFANILCGERTAGTTQKGSRRHVTTFIQFHLIDGLYPSAPAFRRCHLEATCHSFFPPPSIVPSSLEPPISPQSLKGEFPGRPLAQG